MKRGFVKYTKKGNIIPGSLIVTTKGGYPKDGLYREVPVSLCCSDPNGPSTLTFTTDAVLNCPTRTATVTIDNLPAVYDNIIWVVSSTSDAASITAGQGTAEITLDFVDVPGVTYIASVIVLDSNSNVIAAGYVMSAVVDCPPIP